MGPLYQCTNLFNNLSPTMCPNAILSNPFLIWPGSGAYVCFFSTGTDLSKFDHRMCHQSWPCFIFCRVLLFLLVFLAFPAGRLPSNLWHKTSLPSCPGQARNPGPTMANMSNPCDDYGLRRINPAQIPPEVSRMAFLHGV